MEVAYFVAIIPALNPQKQLLHFVHQLYGLGFQSIVIINDGSDEKYNAIFEGLARNDYCHVLKNTDNQGKGYSLKCGVQYVLENLPACEGVMTIGAHGQHRLQDVHLLMKMTKVFANSLVIGVRNMKSPDVTFSQYLENRATSVLFKILYRKHIIDAQSGLRYIPKDKLSWLTHVPGCGFDFDINMLIQAIQRGYPIYEIEIGNARVKKNALLHYDEVMSMKEIMVQMLTQYFKRDQKDGWN